MRINYLVFLFFLIFPVITNSQGIVEPYLGYRMTGNGNLISESNGYTTQYQYNGLLYGFRGGFTLIGFMGGLDYSNSKFNLITKDTMSGVSTTANDPVTKRDLGLFGGFNFNIARVWGTLWLDSDINYNSGTNEGKELDGSGHGLGVGLSVIPLLAINLEYRHFQFDSYQNSGSDSKDGLGTNAFKVDEILFSISIPLSF